MDKGSRKKILVTGGAGFVGSHLCNSLINLGHSVICLDNFYTGDKRNIAHLLNHSHFYLIEHDILSPINIKVNQIYHLACPASPFHYQKDPIYTIKTSVIGTNNILNLAVNCQATLLQASTSEVYGNPQVHPQKENYVGHVNSMGIRACYDEGKRCAETLCFDYYRKFNLNIKVARIFNTYGPNMHPEDGRVVSNFIMQAIKNERITVFGDGKQSRSFCYIDDLIKGLITFMNLEDDFIGPINIGNPKEYNIDELAKKIIQLTKTKSIITYKPLPLDDPKRRKPDIDLAKKRLRWIPTTDLNDGLKKTICYFQNLLKG